MHKRIIRFFLCMFMWQMSAFVPKSLTFCFKSDCHVQVHIQTLWPASQISEYHFYTWRSDQNNLSLECQSKIFMSFKSLFSKNVKTFPADFSKKKMNCQKCSILKKKNQNVEFLSSEICLKNVEIFQNFTFWANKKSNKIDCTYLLSISRETHFTYSLCVMRGSTFFIETSWSHTRQHNLI